MSPVRFLLTGAAPVSIGLMMGCSSSSNGSLSTSSTSGNGGSTNSSSVAGTGGHSSASIGSSGASGSGGGAVLSNAFFSDDFSTNDLSKSENGFVWGGPYNTQVISGFGPPGATHCIQFDFGGPTDKKMAEQDFTLGKDYPEVYTRFYIYYPTGAENPTRGPRVERVLADNNEGDNDKFLRMYGGTHDLPVQPRFGASTYVDSPAGDFKLGPEAGVFPGTNTISQIGAYVTPFVSDASRGTWMKMEFHFKVGTLQPAPNNGIWEAWINDKLVRSISDVNTSGTILRGGYLLGYPNGAFHQPNTKIYIGKVAFSATARVTD